ncbi:MAG TPA: protease complex subunit PrcB family protein [Caulobacteraceae bacterium]
MVALSMGMKTLAPLLLVAALAGCATPPPPLPPLDERADGFPAFSTADARALAETEVRQVLSEAAWAEISRAPTAVLVRRGVSLPRMTQQPDGSWKPEGPYANAAVRTAQGWIGWPGGQRSLLAPETGRELDRLLAEPALWREPALAGQGCTDPGGLTSVIRLNGHEHIATHPCGSVGLTGQVAEIVMSGRIVNWSTVPPSSLPPGQPIARFPDRYEQVFRYSSALGFQTNMVITQRSEWTAMWQRLSAHQGNPPPAPAVDFGREMVLLASMGPQPTGGYAIRIERVIETPNSLEVLVARTSPGPSCGVTAALTHPVDVVRIPASMKPVRWSVRDVVTDCR